ncbi:NAD(P)H-binding protein [Actinoplanes sp. NPDC049548]|uniref:NAD(P)-dependent oxidoreductase n=1 Tax=Actinoplanes sp. NPDC049548 TaxID=3155152 RepID=UPI00344704EE
MRIAVLGATGRTGRHLVAAARARGHEVVALARRPATDQVRADVTEPPTVLAALHGVDAVVSGLGVRRGEDPRTLVAGARLVAAAEVPRIVWLGALGSGVTAGAFRRPTGALLAAVLRHEWDAKAEADAAVRAAGGTVVHAGRLTDDGREGRLVAADQVRSRLIPPTAARSGVAALMIAEAEAPRYAGSTAVTLFG